MSEVETLKLYLKRTKKLYRRWLTQVPKRRVALNDVSNNAKGLHDDRPVTLDALHDCGSVACVAGWAFAFALKDKEFPHDTCSRMDAMVNHYGLRYIHSSLFNVRERHDCSQWREGKERLEERITQLQDAIKDAQRVPA